MLRVQARLSALSLDPKRIVASSAAVAVHALALMLLMLPAQIAPPKTTVDIPMLVLPEFRPRTPLISLPVEPRPQPTTPQRQPMEQVIPVDQTTSPVDQFVLTPPDTVTDSFAVQPLQAFTRISADVAPAPPYPPQALRRRLSGMVTLRVRVDRNGRPVDAAIESSSGSRLLDDSALKFVLARWHFVPAMNNGGPIEAYALVPINFVIER